MKKYFKKFGRLSTKATNFYGILSPQLDRLLSIVAVKLRHLIRWQKMIHAHVKIGVKLPWFFHDM